MDLLKRLEAVHANVAGIRYMLPAVPEAEEVFAGYELAHASIEQFIHNTHNEWFSTIENNIARELQANLMSADKSAGEGGGAAALQCIKYSAPGGLPRKLDTGAF